MRIGLLADIHSHLSNLEACLDELANRDCDSIVQLGDLVDLGADPTDITRPLINAGIRDGVWGNHDFGLMHEPERRVLAGFPRGVRAFLRNQKPHLTFAHHDTSAYACHIDPDLDPFDLNDLWNRRPLPEEQPELANIFRSRPETYLIAGHRHRWFAATPGGHVPWRRQATVELGTHRWFIVLDAVRNGWAAVLDLEQRVLERIRVRPADRPVIPVVDMR